MTEFGKELAMVLGALALAMGLGMVAIIRGWHRMQWLAVGGILAVGAVLVGQALPPAALGLLIIWGSVLFLLTWWAWFTLGYVRNWTWKEWRLVGFTALGVTVALVGSQTFPIITAAVFYFTGMAFMLALLVAGVRRIWKRLHGESGHGIVPEHSRAE